MATIQKLQRVIGMRDTKTNIEAFGGTLEEQAIAFATDTSEIGIYTNGAWVWVGGAAGQYRQFVYVVSAGDFQFVIDGDGNPVLALQDLE